MSLRAATLPLLLAACGLQPYDIGASATSTTATGGSSVVPGTTSSTDAGSSAHSDTGVTTTGPASTGDRPTTGDDTSGPFMPPPDGGTGTKKCDIWAEDCPEGQKCMPYSGDGDSAHESLKCVDIVPNPGGRDEPCTAGPIETGEDTCAEHHLCWFVDPETQIGTCVGMCIGTPDSPACEDPLASCLIPGDAVLILCLPSCNPLLDQCDRGEHCAVTYDNHYGFRCIPDASADPGQTFDPCEASDACDPGLVCLAPEGAVECDPMAPGCCLPFCDTSLPNTCPGAGQECLPWYGQGEAAPGYENIGSCGLPMP